MKARHVYPQYILEELNQVEVAEEHPKLLLPGTFFNHLATRDEFVDDQTKFVIIQIYLPNFAQPKTIFEWFRPTANFGHVFQFINEHFQINQNSYILINKDTNDAYRNLNKLLPNQTRITLICRPNR